MKCILIISVSFILSCQSKIAKNEKSGNRRNQGSSVSGQQGVAGASSGNVEESVTATHSENDGTDNSSASSNSGDSSAENGDKYREIVDDNLEADESDESTLIKPKQLPEIPKIALIFGPGGGKTYAQIGVLQEIQKNKIPVHSVAGIEFGALVASIYAWKTSVNDVEWQMFKIKDDDVFKKNILNGKRSSDFKALNPIVKSLFHNFKAEDLKIPFACPAYNLVKNQVFIMNRGNLEQLLPYCMPYPPFFKPHQNNLASVRDLKIISEYLRHQGANYIIFINVLGGNPLKNVIFDQNSTESLVWAELSSQLAKQRKYVDFVINLNLENYSVVDFNKKRDVMHSGSEQSHKMIQQLAQKLGL